MRLIERLVWCPQPLRATLLRRWAARGRRASARCCSTCTCAGSTGSGAVCTTCASLERRGQPLATADYEFAGKRVHVVAAYAPLADLPRVAARWQRTCAAGRRDRLVVLDLVAWRPGDHADGRRDRGRSAAIARRLRLRPTAAPAGRHRHERAAAQAGASAHPPLHLPPAARRVRRGKALPQPAPDDRQAAGPVAAVQLHACSGCGPPRTCTCSAGSRTTTRSTCGCSRSPRCAT